MQKGGVQDSPKDGSPLSFTDIICLQAISVQNTLVL